jgi:carboxyl-terminal processing protease
MVSAAPVKNKDTRDRVRVPLGVFLCCTLSLALITFFLAWWPAEVPKKPEYAFGLEDKDIFLYLEAITRIRDEASFLDPSTTREKIVQETLKFYLAQQDSFSDYLTRGEYRQFKESQDEKYVGIGMEIERDRDGKFVCMPYPGSPAEKAGITLRDQLKSINGLPVYGKSIFSVAAMARGKLGTEVTFSILTKQGEEKQVRVTRSEVTSETVSIRRIGRKPVIKIFSFTRDTKEKLRHILSSWETDDNIVIDLRSNAGGDFHAAIDSAMLFLGAGRKIVSIKARNGLEVFESKDGAINLTSPVYLWQDERTASAAEVFISALTENNRAV